MSACSRGGESAATFTVTDSAGVAISYSSAPAWGDGSPWTLAAEPAVRIGGAGDDESQTLFRVRTALTLSDGRIAVANSGTGQIRFYSADGAHLADVGRQGQGPGEFQYFTGLWAWPGDSLVASENDRITFMDDEGRLGRTLRLLPAEGGRETWGRYPFADGTLLSASLIRDSGPPRPGTFPGPLQRYRRHDAAGEPLLTLGEQRRGDQWGFMANGGQAYGVSPLTVHQPPHAADGHALYLAESDAPEIRVAGPDGELQRIIRWNAPRIDVDGEIIDRFRGERLGDDDPSSRAFGEAFLDGVPYPDQLPVTRLIFVDAEGYIWLMRYQPNWETDFLWWVFDPEGRWLGDAPLPPNLTVTEIGPDHVMGVVRDELQVEYVVRFELDRAQSVDRP